MERIVLRTIDELAEVVRGTDVRAILTGHLHLQLSGTLADVPVWVTPGVVTRIDLTSPPELARAVLGAGATLVHLGEPSAPMFAVLHARDPRAGEFVYLYGYDTGGFVPPDREFD